VEAGDGGREEHFLKEGEVQNITCFIFFKQTYWVPLTILLEMNTIKHHLKEFHENG
jgi:hypothetical protein